jgi:cytoskeletal protein RodZ
MTAEKKPKNDGGGHSGGEPHNGGGFGVYLKEQREAKGISLQAVAGRTNIQPDILTRIDAELLEQLPESVYVRGFVRAYAEAIGVDPKAAVRRYERHYAAYQQALSARHLRGRRRFVQGVLLVGVLAGALILAVVSFLPESPLGDQADRTNNASTAAPGATSDPPKTAAEGGEQAAPQSAPAASVKTPLKLSAVGLKETTLKIIVDGKRPKVFRLKADTRLEIEAQREFNILVGNARAVTLFLNGQPVVVHGREGQQVTLQLP